MQSCHGGVSGDVCSGQHREVRHCQGNQQCSSGQDPDIHSWRRPAQKGPWGKEKGQQPLAHKQYTAVEFLEVFSTEVYVLGLCIVRGTCMSQVCQFHTRLAYNLLELECLCTALGGGPFARANVCVGVF